MVRITWVIGGPQGTGVDTSANLFGDAIARSGYYIFGNREYYSNIKGRHSYFTLTVSDQPTRSISDDIDILATFEAETVFQHFRQVKGVLIYDKNMEGMKLSNMAFLENEIKKDVREVLSKHGYEESVKGVLDYLKNAGIPVIAVDYDAQLTKIMNEVNLSSTVVGRAKNVIAVSVSFGLLGLDKKFLLSAVSSMFKKEEYQKINSRAVEYGISLVQSQYGLKELKIDGTRLRVDGNYMSAMGKILGGLRLQTYYPITPASDESDYIEANQMLEMENENQDLRKAGAVVLQMEDEIAAVNTAISATLTGARASTATSGPGFSLMAEGIGWAGMNEAPVVVTYYMRGGPSTGLPTRSGQTDLKFAINVGHGEFPRIIIASGDHLEVFNDSFMALNLAERYQTPVIHLIEKTLANSYSIIDESTFNYNPLRISRGKLTKGSDNYKRFEFSDDGISPRAFLGSCKMSYTGDEHNQFGHISEEVNNRFNMYEKRMKKLETADKEIPERERINVYGNPDADTMILTWGSSKLPVLDALDMIKNDGIDIGMLQIKMFSPFPRNTVRKLLENKQSIIAVESSYMAQGAQVVTENTRIEPTHYILKWNGRMITRDEIYKSVRRIKSGATKRVVLNGGV
jgi:2-oxoglutarate ferredoxin oxidoreductase subunit alpha